MIRSLAAILFALLFVRPMAAQPAADFDAAVDDFFDRYYAFYPTAAAGAGLHEYDARLGARDRAAIEAWIAALHELDDRFTAMDTTAMSDDQRLDRALVLRRIRGDLFSLEDVGTWRKDPRYYAGQWDMTLLLLLDYAPLPHRMEAIVSRLERFPALVAAARANIEDPPRPFVEVSLIAYRGWPRFLREDLTTALAGVDDPALQQRFAAARDAAIQAIESYASYLESDVLPTADGDYALGPERYQRMTAVLEGVDLPPEELKPVALAELARLRAATDSLAAVLAPDAPPESRVEAAFAVLAQDQPDGDEIVETAARVIGRLKAFVTESGIGTLLPGDVEVKEIPPYARTNFAYIFIPGPYEQTVRTGFYFIQPLEPGWSERAKQDYLAKNNDWSILNTSVHEAYPGHYYHYNHVHRAPTRAQRLLTAGVTSEGWAHYTEEMSWRQGLAERDPRLGLAVMQDALLRVVRFLSSIGLHTEGMTVEESEEMFRTVAYQDSVNARQQALRGTYDPEYLVYTLGKLMITRIRADAEARAAERGEEFDLGAFHDQLMDHGAPPVPWIGRRILGPDWDPFP